MLQMLHLLLKSDFHLNVLLFSQQHIINRTIVVLRQSSAYVYIEHVQLSQSRTVNAKWYL